MAFAPFGTAHEELEDEQNTAITKKPKRVEDEIVTDEKGRRRFHGAFTGGFSAGYFNTVGSKHGWEPQTFTSTRGEKADNVTYSAADFMDEEDKGQYGFAAKKIKVRDDFLDKSFDNAGGSAQGSTQLAWERAGPSTSNATPAGLSDLVTHLERTICPVNDSIGVKILKKMGWRPGKGIGPKRSRRALERQKVIDARSRGESTRFNEKAVRDIEEIAPETEFAPDDIPKLFIEANNSQHGIGYKPLEHSHVLDASFQFKVDSLKTKLKSKGIRGQAFGVGAFEDDDDDVYTSEDLSKYDYAIGGDVKPNLREIERYDSNFVAATVAERTVLYHAPQPPKHFNTRHRSEPIILKNLPSTMLNAMDHLTPLQKAVFLGDRSGSVMELLSDEDRQKLQLLNRKTEKEVQIKEREKEVKKPKAEPFEEEPLKAHRFKKYVHYLKSGYDMPPPLELTRLEWERELAEFDAHLTPELRALLPSVRSRQEPLANLKTAQPIADLLKSRFQSENSSDTTKPESKLDNERRQAVQEKRFGDLTRAKYKWHPSKLLCKYFNIQDPYPDSRMVGSYELQKQTLQPQSAVQMGLLANLGLPNTQRDVIDRMGREAQDRRLQQDDSGQKKSRFDEDYNKKPENERKFNMVEKPVFLPPIELLQSVFELPDKEDASSSSSDSEVEDTRPSFASLIDKFKAKPMEKPKEKFITILDVVPDDDDYGPRLPESLNPAIPPEEKAKFIPSAPHLEVIQLESSSDESESSYQPAKKHKKRSKSRSKDKEKKHRKRSESRSGSSDKKHKKKKDKKHKSKSGKKDKRKRRRDSASD